MNSLIQVTGMPRSGTAWVAMLLSLNPQCLAFHDLISTEEDWRGRIDRALHEWKWVADCGTYQYAPKASAWKSTKIALIQNPEESRVRANEAFKQDAPPDSYDYIWHVFQQWVIQHGALTVPYRELWKDSTAARLIWQHAFGEGIKFPEEKVRFLISMDVQRANPEAAFAENSLSARTANLF
jgi:hypothetical protein